MHDQGNSGHFGHLDLEHGKMLEKLELDYGHVLLANQVNPSSAFKFLLCSHHP